ncbi:hypothetical protein QBC33DRAFT_175504 [Phialemonium atrogriseum]|uniref:Ubiquitin-like protease family profile domain-containing protein n=1 Tax=Phialemonium atrogriseum TaxID=1093897 RepID=A0AAJ0BVI1_9PEZI|nr:uncharacterized protein QBC33DRAFT_175504 [Phialemonium atrogriseum]KAK1765249.1 hypothetical protein QBC33DRAFT_175504 [Phialemonium atrogriseum]
MAPNFSSADEIIADNRGPADRQVEKRTHKKQKGPHLPMIEGKEDQIRSPFLPRTRRVRDPGTVHQTTASAPLPRSSTPLPLGSPFSQPSSQLANQPTTDRPVPTAAAVPVPASPQPGQWLTDAVIVHTLQFVAALRPVHFTVAEPLLVTTDKVVPPEYWQKLHQVLGQNTSILVPLNIPRAHWCLAHFRVGSRGLVGEIFDSWPNSQYASEAAALAHRFADGLGTSAARGSVWRTKSSAPTEDSSGPAVGHRGSSSSTTPQAVESTYTRPWTPKQSDSYECGVAIIAISFYLAAKIELPAQINLAMWRDVIGLVVQRLLDKTLVKDVINSNPKDFPFLHVVKDLGAHDDATAFSVKKPAFLADNSSSSRISFLD